MLTLETVSLTRDGFNKRWRRYTSAINPQTRTTSDKSG